jgi:hypothetical protein
LIIKGAVGPAELAAMNAAVDRQEAAKPTEREGLAVAEARRLMADPDSYEGQEWVAAALQGSATASGAESPWAVESFRRALAYVVWRITGDAC